MSKAGIFEVLMRRRAAAPAAEAVDLSHDSTKDTPMSTTVNPTVASAPAPSTVPASAATPAAPEPAAPRPPVAAAPAAESVATLEQLEASFPGEGEFVLASLREKRTLAAAQTAYIAVLKDRNQKLAAQAAEQDKALKGLGMEGMGVAPLPAQGADDAAGKPDGFKTYEQAVEHYRAAGDKQPFRTAAVKHPALHTAWRAEEGRKRAEADHQRELRRRGG